jgi:hypothetical protein
MAMNWEEETPYGTATGNRRDLRIVGRGLPGGRGVVDCRVLPRAEDRAPVWLDWSLVLIWAGFCAYAVWGAL